MYSLRNWPATIGGQSKLMKFSFKSFSLKNSKISLNKNFVSLIFKQNSIDTLIAISSIEYVFVSSKAPES
jgi:hypothetical protein